MPSTRLYGPSGAPGAAGSVALNANGQSAAVLPATQVVANTTETVLVNPANPASALVLSIPSGSILDKRRFRVEASGTIKGAGTTNATLKLLSGTSTTVASDTSLGASSASAVNSTTAPFYVEANLVYDGATGLLAGTIEYFINGTLTAKAAIANQISGILGNSGSAVVNFVLSIAFSAAFATNQILLQDFCVSF